MSGGSWLRVASVAAIGAIAGLTLGCGNTTTLGIGRYQKVVVYPQKGDTLKFSHFNATFLGLSPCDKRAADEPLSECKVNVPAGHYRFNCDPSCADPEIEVGSIGIEKRRSATTVQSDVWVAIWCDQGSVHIDPTQVAITIKTGQTIAWDEVGTSEQAVPGWSVTPADFCADSATPVNKDHPYCKVGAPNANKYTYKVKANPNTSCSDASGTVTVTP